MNYVKMLQASLNKNGDVFSEEQELASKEYIEKITPYFNQKNLEE